MEWNRLKPDCVIVRKTSQEEMAEEEKEKKEMAENEKEDEGKEKIIGNSVVYQWWVCIDFPSGGGGFNLRFGHAYTGVVNFR